MSVRFAVGFCFFFIHSFPSRANTYIAIAFTRDGENGRLEIISWFCRMAATAVLQQTVQ